ncbi:MAG: DUF2480 family protein [Sphingobacteriales bacterium]|nr:MAG: DUF2480 family protein [Sphingobacteriales bacterium]
MEAIVNKVAESGILTLDLANFIPTDEQVKMFDLKPFLFREMILREKDYRAALQTHNWEQYAGKHVFITCTTDAIIPMWAYMLASVNLEPQATSMYYGTAEETKLHRALLAIDKMDASEYENKRVVVKGCGDIPISEKLYVAITQKLRPVALSLMYGEPCSTVPIYKRPKPQA